jgi:uncharacterized DUF497 family protein
MRVFENMDFEWDEGNIDKNYIKHNVQWFECEQVFFDEHFYVGRDVKHSQKEERWLGLGKTYEGRKLCIIFTIRNKKIRIVSARDMSKKERKQYEKEIKKNT